MSRAAPGLMPWHLHEMTVDELLALVDAIATPASTATEDPVAHLLGLLG
jgi:hypothetical protein